jgi:RNA polymerase sigma-70 factor (ECF subfamily)
MNVSHPFQYSDYAGDSALAEHATAGDRSAQRELFHALKGMVHATLYRVLGSNEQLEDLLQDVFVEIFRSLPRYRGEAKLTTWAAPIAARVAYHHLRSKRARRDRVVVPFQLHVVGSPEDHAQHREGLQRLYRLLGRMSPEQHLAFALFAVDGRSIEEIATMTESSTVAVKNRISRARRKLWAAARKDRVLASYLVQQGEVE